MHQITVINKELKEQLFVPSNILFFILHYIVLFLKKSLFISSMKETETQKHLQQGPHTTI